MEVMQTNYLNEVYYESRIALDTTTVEADWLRELLMDNQIVIVKVDSSKDNMKSSRHIKRPLKSIRKMGNSRVIIMDYIHTEKNLTDPFTKGLSHNVMDATYKEMGLRPTYAIP
jgi:hypothetical protein